MMARHELRDTNLALQSGMEQGLVSQHGAGHLQEAVRHAAERACMTVAASTQCSVLGLADTIMLDSDASPVVDGVLKSVVGREATHHNDGLAGAPGNRGHTAETSQSLVVSPSYGIMGFCEQRGEDDPADAWKRTQDVHVTLRRSSVSGSGKSPRIGILRCPLK